MSKNTEKAANEAMHKSMRENMNASREKVIAAVIAAQYSIDDQIALIRQKDTKPEEYQAFFDFAEDVKAKVTAEFSAKEADPE